MTLIFNNLREVNDTIFIFASTTPLILIYIIYIHTREEGGGRAKYKYLVNHFWIFFFYLPPFYMTTRHAFALHTAFHLPYVKATLLQLLASIWSVAQSCIFHPVAHAAAFILDLPGISNTISDTEVWPHISYCATTCVSLMSLWSTLYIHTLTCGPVVVLASETTLEVWHYTIHPTAHALPLLWCECQAGPWSVWMTFLPPPPGVWSPFTVSHSYILNQTLSFTAWKQGCSIMFLDIYLGANPQTHQNCLKKLII